MTPETLVSAVPPSIKRHNSQGEWPGIKSSYRLRTGKRFVGCVLSIIRVLNQTYVLRNSGGLAGERTLACRLVSQLAFKAFVERTLLNQSEA